MLCARDILLRNSLGAASGSGNAEVDVLAPGSDNLKATLFEAGRGVLDLLSLTPPAAIGCWSLGEAALIPDVVGLRTSFGAPHEGQLCS